MPTGTLPAEGKSIWEKVHDKALKTTCKGRSDPEECAAKIAWGAVKQAGWKKDAQGKWHKSNLSEFSLAITRASYDKVTNQMRWRAVASDTDEDSYGDNMSLKLFSKFIERIKSEEQPPEMFRSDFWAGGLPYLSVSHYPDLDGNGVPGTVEDIYIDGNRLKAIGTFDDTPLGRACFKAVCNDLYHEEKSDFEDKVRISIAFLDYAHKHKSSGETFERKSLEDICPYCLEELVKGEISGKEFIDGHLIHLAMTRVPVNKRTDMEVERSMTTRKEDAASIIGDELADELEEEAALIGKSEALVIKSEEEEIEDESIVEEAEIDEAPDVLVEEAMTKKEPWGNEPMGSYLVHEDPEHPTTWHLPVKKHGKPDRGLATAAYQALFSDHRGNAYGGSSAGEAKKKLRSFYKSQGWEWPTDKKSKSEVDMEEEPQDVLELLRSEIAELKASITKPEPAPEHPLDGVLANLKAKYDALVESNTDEVFQEVKAEYEAVGRAIMEGAQKKEEPEEVEATAQPDLVAALSEVMKPFAQELALLRAQLADNRPRMASVVPERRSISPSVLATKPVVSTSETPKLRELVRRSVFGQ